MDQRSSCGATASATGKSANRDCDVEINILTNVTSLHHRRALAAPIAVALLIACSPPTNDTSWPCQPEAYPAHNALSLPLQGEIGDPHVIKVGETWYLYPSQDSVRPDGFQVLTSDDLVHWRDRGLIWQPTAGTWNEPGPPLSVGPDCWYWAPSVHQGRDGAFYMYYTARCKIGVARAESPLGPFVDLNTHPLVGGGFGDVGDRDAKDPMLYNQLAIDPFLLDDPLEGLLLYFVAYSPVSNVHVIHLSDYATTVGAKTLLLEPDPFSWESFVAEGVWVERVSNDYHLMYSGNFVRTTAYAIGAARSSSALGPFTRYPSNPVLATSAPWGIYGPGHHSVVVGTHGDRLIVYHADVDSGKNSPRAAHLASLCLGTEGELVVRPDVTLPP